jgi:DNA-binding SARP family transcriptional activator
MSLPIDAVGFAPGSDRSDRAFTDFVNTMDSTLQPGVENFDCGFPLDNSVWYVLTLPAPATVTINAGQDREAIVQAYTGTSLSNLTEIAYGPSSANSITFPAAGGTTYYIRASRYLRGGEAGNLVINASLQLVPSQRHLRPRPARNRVVHRLDSMGAMTPTVHDAGSLTALPGEQTAPVLRIEVLGAMRLWLAEEEIFLRQAQQRAILALLVLSEHAPVTPERLIQTLWTGEPPASARNVLHTQVKRLRQACEPNRMSHSRSTLLPSAGDGYVLHRSASVDLWQFRSLVRRAARARTCHDDAAVFAHVGEAVSLWRDTPFADVAPVRDSAPARALGEQYACAVGWYAEAGIRTGHADEVLSLVEQAADARPLDEAAQALLMRAYHATARRSDGFTVYQRTQQALAEELGVDPGRELRATYEALLRDKLASGVHPPIRRIQ